MLVSLYHTMERLSFSTKFVGRWLVFTSFDFGLWK